MNKPITVDRYKNVDIHFNPENSKLYFDFEGERVVSYLFEAHQIIDEPVWEDCDLEGYMNELDAMYKRNAIRGGIRANLLKILGGSDG